MASSPPPPPPPPHSGPYLLDADDLRVHSETFGPLSQSPPAGSLPHSVDSNEEPPPSGSDGLSPPGRTHTTGTLSSILAPVQIAFDGPSSSSNRMVSSPRLFSSSENFSQSPEETLSDAVAGILRDALTGIDKVTDPAELRRRLRRMIGETRHVQAYTDTLHQQLTANQEALQAATQHRGGASKRVSLRSDPSAVEPEILAVFLQWGWSEDEIREKILGPEHTLEKAVYHLLRNYLKDGGAVPAPDKRVLVNRAESAQALLQHLVTLQTPAAGRTFQSRPEIGRNPSQDTTVVSSPRSKPKEHAKRKGFSLAWLFRWRFRGPSTAPFATLRALEDSRTVEQSTGVPRPGSPGRLAAKGKERAADSARPDSKGPID